MKKHLLSLSILSSFFSYADNFNVIIKSEDINYDIAKFTDETTYSEWSSVSIEECVSQYNQSDYYKNVDFVQIDDCKETLERTLTNTRVFDDGTEEIISTSIEVDYIDKQVSYITQGTHLEATCKDIINNGFSHGSGLYTASSIGLEEEIYCDMTTDGGGWTLLHGGTINNETTDSEFYNYNISNVEYIDDKKLYKADDVFSFSLPFKETRTVMQGETSLYENHIVYAESTTNSASIESLFSLNITSYKVKNTQNGNNNEYPLLNCAFSEINKGLINCDNGVESQNPWYQRAKIEHHSDENTFGIHNCSRYILQDGSSISSCSEREISADIFSGSCQDETFHWKNRITRDSCNYRSNIASYYKWNEWIR